MNKPLGRKWAILIACLMLISGIRFNRNPGIVERELGDAAYYVAYVQYWQSIPSEHPLIIPFSWRPLAPALASLLPFSPMTALNVVNMGFLILGLVFLDKTLALLGVGAPWQMRGDLLYIFSFPVFYYGTIGYIDPCLVGWVSVGIYLILKEKWGLLTGLLIVGMLTKEGIIILIPPAVVKYYFSHTWPKALIMAWVWGGVYVGVGIALQRLAPGSESEAPGTHAVSFWNPYWDILAYNAQRVNAYLSGLLTLGLPGGLFLLGAFKNGRSWTKTIKQQTHLQVLLIGIGGVMATYAYSWVSAYADGRILWPICLFMIPLVIYLIQSTSNSLSHDNFSGTGNRRPMD